jgi:hypothetical protein
LIAIDGTKVVLPQTHELKTHFGSHGGGSKTSPSETVMANALLYYDVLNEFILSIKFDRVDKSEQAILSENLSAFSPHNNIYIMDRGFGSAGLFAYFAARCIFFVARLRLGFNKVTREFMSISSREIVTEFCLNEDEEFSIAETITHFPAGHKVKVRLTKIELPTGETEILATNLFSKKVKIADLGYIYNKRWAVETSISSLKSQLQCMVFSGIKPQAIAQELYANVILFNLRALIINDESRLMPACEKHKIVKINKNVALGVLSPQLMACFWAEKMTKILKQIKQYIIKNKVTTKIRDDNVPREKKKRDKKLTRKRNLYTQTNYKRAV